MTSKTLIEKIEALPPENRAEVEHLVDALSTRTDEDEPGDSDELFRRIHERRERLRRERGVFPDSTEIIRELRESDS